MTQAPLLQVRNLVKHFPVLRGALGWAARKSVRAVDGVSFDVARGETFGLVGESGCGKSTLGKVIVRLEAATSGVIRFEGNDLMALRGAPLRRARRDVQMIFQDPYASLDPRMTVGEILAEPFAIHGLARGAERTRRIRALLESVGLTAAQAGRYPHEFSGGQRQRVAVARALALNPKLIVCDEPVSALDVSIQSQVINLLAQLQKELGLSYVFIAHGLAVVKHISDRIGVMYLGKLVEVAPSRALFARPAHPYTQALIAAIPVPNPRARRDRQVLEGDVPSPIDPPPGCRFHTRCPFAATVGEKCRTVEPSLRSIGDGHAVACHLHGA